MIVMFNESDSFKALLSIEFHTEGIIKLDMESNCGDNGILVLWAKLTRSHVLVDQFRFVNHALHQGSTNSKASIWRQNSKCHEIEVVFTEGRRGGKVMSVIVLLGEFLHAPSNCAYWLVVVDGYFRESRDFQDLAVEAVAVVDGEEGGIDAAQRGHVVSIYSFYL